MCIRDSAVPAGVAVGVAVGVFVGVAVPAGVAVGVAVGVLVGVAVGVFVGVGVGVPAAGVSIKVAAEIAPVSPAPPSRTRNVHVPLIWPADNPANVGVISVLAPPPTTPPVVDVRKSPPGTTVPTAATFAHQVGAAGAVSKKL